MKSEDHKLISYDNYRLSREEKLHVILTVMIILLVISWVFFNSIWPFLAGPLLYGRGKKHYAQMLRTKRKNQLLMEFRDFLFTLSSIVATGQGMKDGILQSQSALRDIYGDESLMWKEMRHMSLLLSSEKNSDVQVLEDFAIRSGCEDIWEFITIYKVCKTSGGNLVLAVSKCAQIIGDKISLCREIEVFLAQKKLEGYIILLMPVVVIGGLKATTSDYFAIMYETIGGNIIMGIVVCVMIFAYSLIERIASVEI